ncbi:Tannase/feruloyl esterase [Bisporella sp. PMI_857]|nr:Tannase/feruloyl esterase [Bisporella sp. PMI_857]
MLQSFYNNSIAALACLPTTFQNPKLFGAEFFGNVNVVNTTFCNVTATYTHPGQNDTVRVQVWMPTQWNGRMMGHEGSGEIAGLFDIGFGATTAAAQVSPGNVNLYLLQNLASVSLEDATMIAKSFTNNYYSQSPKYSYWNGCSQGGRQGYMLAQRYPDAYDGIAGAAPAIHFPEFVIGDYWGTLAMDLNNNSYPNPCEINAITRVAITACDALDGVRGGVISDPTPCRFDPFRLVGRWINCTDTNSFVKISQGAAVAVSAVWSGAEKSGNTSLWYGVSADSVLTGSSGSGLLNPTCSTNGTCTRAPFSLNASADLTTMRRKDFDNLFRSSVSEYAPIMGTNDPDLSRFRRYNHSSAGTQKSCDAVAALDPKVADFYQLFLVPGVAHCFGGPGAYPDTAFEALRAWVEDDITPSVLNATPTLSDTPILRRSLCPYPKKQYFDGMGSSNSWFSFYCQ